MPAGSHCTPARSRNLDQDYFYHSFVYYGPPQPFVAYVRAQQRAVRNNDRLYAPWKTEERAWRCSACTRACTRLLQGPDRQVQVINIRWYPWWIPPRCNARPARNFVRTVISNRIRIISETQLPTNSFPAVSVNSALDTIDLNLTARFCRWICGLMTEIGLNYPPLSLYSASWFVGTYYPRFQSRRDTWNRCIKVYTQVCCYTYYVYLIIWNSYLNFI